MPSREMDHSQLVTLARERRFAEENRDWAKGVNVARECIALRGTSIDYCWLSFFLHRSQQLQDALDAIDQAIQLDITNESAARFRMRIVQEKDSWNRYMSQQRSREEARIRADIEEQRRQAFESQQRWIREREAERDLAERRARKPSVSQAHQLESADPYEGLRELAEQAAGLAQRPIADPAAGGIRHTNSYRSSMGVVNEYGGYGGHEEQDLESNTYSPIDEEE